MQYNSAMKSRTVKINARGLHVLNQHYALLRSISGGQGGRGSTGYLDRLKTWFYHGFKKRYNLSNRKIASISQKLPTNWQRHLRTQQQSVAAAQFPQEVELDDSEKVNVPGIDDADWYNFYHVQVWQDPVRTYSWRKKDR
eukprot:scaffold13631_cov38-Cyclotella_meneghiniana.AAC.19